MNQIGCLRGESTNHEKLFGQECEKSVIPCNLINFYFNFIITVL